MTVSGEAPQEIRKHPLALSLELETPSGRKLASRARLKGLATSANPAIGQFVYFDIKPGRFTASASAFLADGIKIKSAKLVPLVPEASDILLDACTVDHESSGANLSPLSPEAARAASFQQQMREQARRFGIQVWPRLRPVLSSILGVERTNRITELGAAKLR